MMARDAAPEGTLADLLARSQAFSDALLSDVLQAATPPSTQRHDAALSASRLAFEHALGLRLLLQAHLPSSAVVLLRAQYESLLRAAWLLYAATDDQVDKMSAPLTQAGAAAAQNVHGAGDMLQALERALEANAGLRGLVHPLRELRDASWTAMNAFAHSGLHALARTRDGFPEQLAVDVVKTSNGMVHMAARLTARLLGSGAAVDQVERRYLAFVDVLPVVTAPKGA